MLHIDSFPCKDPRSKLIARILDPDKILPENQFLYLLRHGIRNEEEREQATAIHSIHQHLLEAGNPCNNVTDLDFGVGKTIKLCDSLRFEMIDPCLKNQTQRLFIIAQSGTGKSTWIANYLKKYERMFPSNKIFMISRKEDEAFTGIKLKYVDLEKEEYIKKPLTYKDFPKSCIVVFDDTTCYPDRDVRLNCNRLRDDILQLARSKDISLISTSHKYSNRDETGVLWTESTWVVLSLTSQETQALDAIKQRMPYNIKKVETIWKALQDKTNGEFEGQFIALHAQAPNIILSAHECHIPK